MHEIKTKEDLLKLGDLQRGSLNLPPGIKIVLMDNIELDIDLKFLGSVVIDGGRQRYLLTMAPNNLIKCSTMTTQITFKNIRLKASTLFKLNARSLDTLSLINAEVSVDDFGTFDLNILRLIDTDFGNIIMESGKVLRMRGLIVSNLWSNSKTPLLDISQGIHLSSGVFADNLKFVNGGGLINIMNIDETNAKESNATLYQDSCYVSNIDGMHPHEIFQQRFAKMQYRSVSKLSMKHYLV